MLKVIACCLVAAVSWLLTARTGEARKARAMSGPLAVMVIDLQGRPLRHIVAGGDVPSFAVVVRNTSQIAVNVWDEGCSWGYDNVTFDIIDSTGHHSVARKTHTSFRANMPLVVTLSPGQTQVRKINLAASHWTGFPLPPKGQLARIRIRVIYEIPADAQTKAENVWSGRIESTYQSCVLSNPA